MPILTRENRGPQLLRIALLGLCFGFLPAIHAQTSCNHTPAYSPCDFVFELSDADAAAHPNPYRDVDVKAEFRGPRHKTYTVPAFWDGGKRIVVRFSPAEGGEWTYKLSGNIAAWEGKEGTFTAEESESPGFLRVANVHHFAYTERNKPHLWMGVTELDFGSLDDAAFRAVADARAAQKFTHLRGLVMGEGLNAAFAGADQPNLQYFQRLDTRVRFLHDKGITTDLILAGGGEFLTHQFPTWQQRRAFVRFVAG